MTHDPRAYCLVGCAMARGFFESGEEAEGLVAYSKACEAQSRVRDPLGWLECFIACEHILRTFIWDRGTSPDEEFTS